MKEREEEVMVIDKLYILLALWFSRDLFLKL